MIKESEICKKIITKTQKIKINFKKNPNKVDTTKKHVL